MSNPVVNVTGPTASVVPGSAVVFNWVATDPDTRTLNGSWSGHDDQGNIVSGAVTVNVQDHFTMDTFTLNGVPLAIDNTARKATGVAPLAP